MKNNDRLFTSLLYNEYDSLESRRDELTEQLSQAALRLLQIETQLEHEQVPPVEMRIGTAVWTYQDDGYTGGYDHSWKYSPQVFDVTSHSLTFAYLAALASQSYPIPCSLKSVDHPLEYLAINLGTIRFPSDSLQKPPQEITEQFNNLAIDTADLIKTLQEKSWRENPYKDIPIKINTADLRDVLLRKELLQYCHEADPELTIQEIKKQENK